MHLFLADGKGDIQQGLQQAAADALGAMLGQDHERELGLAVRRDILAVTQHRAIAADCQHCDAIALLDGLEAPQQCQVGCIAMGKVALVKPGAVHRSEKIGHLLAIAGVGGPDLGREEIDGPGLAGAHDRTPEMKSTAASITAGSSSRRRCPRPRVACRRAPGQLST